MRHGIRYLIGLLRFLISFYSPRRNNNIPRIKKCIESLAKNYGTEIGELRAKCDMHSTPEQLSRATPEEWISSSDTGMLYLYHPKHFAEHGVPMGTTEEKHTRHYHHSPEWNPRSNCILSIRPVRLHGIPYRHLDEEDNG